MAAGDDGFFQQLQSSSDGFAVCADYFGRGLFSEGVMAQPEKAREERV